MIHRSWMNLSMAALLAAAMAAASAGCAATSEYMRPAQLTGPPTPPPGQALVVFVRPSSFALGLRFTILSAQGQFLGDSLPASNFAIILPPGQHVFFGWAENTSALRADLAPDRTYYVEVAPKMGFGSARCHLLAITPRAESWAKLSTWLRETAAYLPDTAAGQAYLASRAPDVADRLRRGHETLGEYSPEELAERTLFPGDGIPARSAAPAAPAAPAPAPAPEPPAPPAPVAPAPPPPVPPVQ
jgi:hypothetical protein